MSLAGPSYLTPLQTVLRDPDPPVAHEAYLKLCSVDTSMLARILKHQCLVESMPCITDPNISTDPDVRGVVRARVSAYVALNCHELPSWKKKYSVLKASPNTHPASTVILKPDNDFLR